MEELRKFHNEVKKDLIQRNARNAHVVMDFAIGRGGDLFKYEHAHVKDVVGFDNHYESLYGTNGALERYSQAKNSRASFKLNLNVLQVDLCNPSNIALIQQYYNQCADAVSCQFALHYFFKSESICRTFLECVSSMLKPGGKFFGTTIDGDRLQKLYAKETNLYKISMHSLEGCSGEFGKSYEYTLKSPVTKHKQTYFELQGTSTEYMVSVDTLKRLCNEYGMDCKEIKYFNSYLRSPKYKHVQDMNVHALAYIHFGFTFVKRS